MPEPIDWDLAAATAMRLAPRGPDLKVDDARAVVREIRALAREAVDPVREVTGLQAPLDSEVCVIDRREWIASNVEGMRVVLSQWATLAERTENAPAVVRGLGSRGTALQLGAVLAWLSTKVLGQFEVFASRPGRLLLVAPSIVSAEQALAVPERDFRLWVCLHEETHRVQFGAVPWLSDHLLALIGRFLETSELGTVETLHRLLAFAYAAVRSIRSDVDVITALLTTEQRAVLDEITALMTLLEGHADFVMDEVGPGIVPTIPLIRERFTARRENPGPVDGALRRMVGLDAKLRQYADGSQFVREVVEEVGMEGLNLAWTSPSTLPTAVEIHDPGAWVRRTRLPDLGANQP